MFSCSRNKMGKNVFLADMKYWFLWDSFKKALFPSAFFLVHIVPLIPAYYNVFSIRGKELKT